MSLREDILAALDAKVVRLEVPEWKTTVFLRVMSGGERDAFETVCQPDPKTGRKSLINFRARFAAIVLGDEQGNRIFTDADIPALAKKSARALDRILEAGMKHNGFSESDVEELEGKSESGQSVDSGTSSP